MELELPIVSLDHVGIASPGSTMALSRLLGAGEIPGRVMPSGVAVGRFGPGAALELVWPARPSSPVEGFLARRGPGLHHVAFGVAGSMEEVHARLTAAGVRLTGPVEPSSDGRPSLFLHPSSTGGVLVELVEEAS